MGKVKFLRGVESHYNATTHQDGVYFTTDDDNVNSIIMNGRKYGVPYVETTYSALKNLRDGGYLTPGAWYRITDYVTTTTQADTQSVNHPFDVIVLATSTNTLSEEARAIQHSGDTYFANSNLDAWQIWYCLDNDKSRFAWADDSEDFSIPNTIKVSNKSYIRNANSDRTYNNNQYYAWSGNVVYYTLSENPEINDVIYRWEQDPFSDEAGVYIMRQQTVRVSAVTSGYEGRAKEAIITYYDHLHNNLSFKRDTTTNNGVLINNGTTYYLWVQEDNLTRNVYTLSECPEVGNSVYYYKTLGGGLEQVGEISSYQPPIHYYNGRGVIYRMIDEFNNDIKYDFKNIQFKRTITDGEYDENGTVSWCYTLNVWYNDMCQDASIVGNTLPNDEDFVSGVYDNRFGYATAYDLHIDGVNTFAFALGNNVVLSIDNGEYFGIHSNTIGNYFYDNTIGNGFYSNTIGNDFNYNTIGNFFYANTIGNSFNYNTVGNDFNYNTIGNGFNNNTIGNDFSSNMIGNYFQSNTIGTRNGNTVTTIDYVRYIRVEDGVQYVDITTSATTNNNAYLQNITISQGVAGTSNSNRKTITHPTVNDTIQTIYRPANSQVITV